MSEKFPERLLDLARMADEEIPNDNDRIFAVRVDVPSIKKVLVLGVGFKSEASARLIPLAEEAIKLGRVEDISKEDLAAYMYAVEGAKAQLAHAGMDLEGSQLIGCEAIEPGELSALLEKYKESRKPLTDELNRERN